MKYLLNITPFCEVSLKLSDPVCTSDAYVVNHFLTPDTKPSCEKYLKEKFPLELFINNSPSNTLKNSDLVTQYSHIQDIISFR